MENVCYQCGGEGGTWRTLCPSCSRANDEKRKKLQADLRVDTIGAGDPILVRLTNLPLGRALIVFLLFALLLGGLFLIASLLGLQPLALFSACAALVGFGLVIVSWGATAALLSGYCSGVWKGAVWFPPLTYFAAVRSAVHNDGSHAWHEVRPVFFAHLGSLVMLFAIIRGTSVIGVDIFDRHSYMEPKRPHVSYRSP